MDEDFPSDWTQQPENHIYQNQYPITTTWQAIYPVQATAGFGSVSSDYSSTITSEALPAHSVWPSLDSLGFVPLTEQFSSLENFNVPETFAALETAPKRTFESLPRQPLMPERNYLPQNIANLVHDKSVDYPFDISRPSSAPVIPAPRAYSPSIQIHDMDLHHLEGSWVQRSPQYQQHIPDTSREYQFLSVDDESFGLGGSNSFQFPGSTQFDFSAIDTGSIAFPSPSIPNDFHFSDDVATTSAKSQATQPITAKRKRTQNDGRGNKRRRTTDKQQLHRACWRCKRYKKPCTGEGSVCDMCITSGFRIWPSAFGCRRGNLENFVKIILPDNSEDILSTLDTPYVKPFSWRKGTEMNSNDLVSIDDTTQGDIWDQLKYKVQSICVHGPGILELIDIGAKHQRQKQKCDPSMTSAVTAVSLSIDLYHAAISAGQPELFDPGGGFPELFKKTRTAHIAAVDHFLRSCLTGRLKDWLPTFISALILVFGYVVLADTIMAIPISVQKRIWSDIQNTVVDLRHYLYSTARDLLIILAKGTNLLEMECWELAKDKEDPTKLVRNREGMRMMDDDENTFDRMREFQLWRKEFSPYLDEDHWMTTLPFTVKNYPIMSFARMFSFSIKR